MLCYCHIVFNQCYCHIVFGNTPTKVILSGTTVVFFYHRRDKLPNDISQNIHQVCYEICIPFLDEIKNYLPKNSGNKMTSTGGQFKDGEYYGQGKLT